MADESLPNPTEDSYAASEKFVRDNKAIDLAWASGKLPDWVADELAKEWKSANGS